MALKLGSETASVTNWMMSGLSAQEPEVGMGATVLHWTDRTACTVVAWDGKTLVVQEDNAERADGNGMSESQAYTYTPNPEGRKYEYRRDAKGQWRTGWVNPDSGRWNFSKGGQNLSLGTRQQYHDYSF